jgi:hypothetical protein
MATLIVTPPALLWDREAEAAAAFPKRTNAAHAATAVALKVVLCIHVLLRIIPLSLS